MKNILTKIKIIFLITLFTISLTALAENQNNTNKLPMLWDFGAEKCIPCKMMAPILEKMETEYNGKLIVKFTDVWIRENVQTAKQYGIQAIPTQIFFDKNGKELWRHTGYISESDILAKWKSLGYDFNTNKANTPEVQKIDSK